MARDVKHPMIFLDRDGTIIVDKIYLNNPEEVEFIDGVIDNLIKLYQAGFKLVIVTNQSGVARGKVDLENLHAIHNKISNILDSYGVKLFKIYYCPHLPEDNCDCRKPKTGMVKEIESMIDKDNSFVIGDKDTDIGFGKNLGVKTILLTYDKTTNFNDMIYTPDFIVTSFDEATKIILREDKNKT